MHSARNRNRNSLGTRLKLKFMRNKKKQQNATLDGWKRNPQNKDETLFCGAYLSAKKRKDKILRKASLNGSSSLIAAVNDTRDNLSLRHLSHRSTGVDLVHSVPLSTKPQPPSLTLKQIYNLCEAQICELTSFKLQDYVSLLIFSVWTPNYFCPHAYPCM